MPKGKGKPHIYLLLSFGAKPSELIRLGYNRHTIYSYSRRFRNVKNDYDNDLGKLINLRNEVQKKQPVVW